MLRIRLLMVLTAFFSYCVSCLADSCTYTFTVPADQLTTKCEITAEIREKLDKLQTDVAAIQIINRRLETELTEVKSTNMNLTAQIKKLTTRISIQPTGPRISFTPMSNLPGIPKEVEPVAGYDCDDILRKGMLQPGIYKIRPKGSLVTFKAHCVLGWTLIQRRFDGQESFRRNWDDYLGGFGNASFDHWLGNEKIYALTNQNVSASWTLHIAVQGFSGKWYYSEYTGFRVEDEVNRYRLKLGPIVKTNYKDGMKESRDQKFSTYDYDHDQWRSGSCARYYSTGWWIKRCGGDINQPFSRMRWADRKVKKSIIKIRPTGAKYLP